MPELTYKDLIDAIDRLRGQLSGQLADLRREVAAAHTELYGRVGSVETRITRVELQNPAGQLDARAIMRELVLTLVRWSVPFTIGGLIYAFKHNWGG